MSLIIGARCADGVVMLADRRVVRGDRLERPRKKLFVAHQVAIGMAGPLGAIEKMRSILLDHEGDEKSMDEVVRLAEGALREVYEGFKDLEREGFTEVMVSGLKGLHRGKAVLYGIIPGRPAEEFEYLSCGATGDYRWSASLVDLDLPVEKAAGVLSVLMALAEKTYFSIGDGMDVAILRDDRGPQVLPQKEADALVASSRAVCHRLPAHVTEWVLRELGLG